MTGKTTHEQCPQCAARGRDRHRDNLAVYADGSVYCFSCGFSSNGSRTRTFIRKQQKQKNDVGNIHLPSDCSDYLPNKAIEWLNKYDITKDEIAKHKFMWSDDKQGLVFPVYGTEDDLIMYQYRYFGPNPDHPKYVTYGFKKDVFHIIGEGNVIVVVEDLISAIKVSRVTAAMPLWGSSLHSNQAKVLSDRYSNLGIWLDSDKRKDALKFANRWRWLFDTVNVISTELDPKEYSDVEIADFLRRADRE